jgi:hypothetical protein
MVVDARGFQLTPSIAPFTQGLESGVQKIMQGRQQEAQKQERDRFMDVFSFSTSLLEQPTELRRQALNSRLVQAQQSGNEQEINAIGQMLQLDDVSLEQDIREDQLRSGSALGINPNQIGQLGGRGQTGFQTNAPIITEQEIDGKKQKFFTAFQSDRSTGKARVVNTPIEGELINKLGLSAGDIVSQEQQIALSKATGKDLGAAQTAQLAAETAALKETATERAKTQEKTRLGIIESGRTAAPLLVDINRGLELIDKVNQGGFAAFEKEVTDLFGSTSGDVGELNRILAGNVLAGLSAFTGAISEGERAFVEKMETSLRTGKEVNRRQLQRLKRIHENQIKKSVSLAKKDDDFATLESIRIDLEGSKLGQELFKSQAKVKPVSDMSDEDLFK